MEIKLLLEAVSDAYKLFRENFEYGKNTDEMLEVFKNSLKKPLGSVDLFYDYIWGKDSLNIDGVTENYIPKEGDTLIMDVSVGKNGVWCDVCRTFFVGDATPLQREIFELVKSTLRAGHKSLKLGARAADVYNAVNGVYIEAGKTLVHHAGHKIGKKALLPPQFLPENESLIIENGYYTIETGLYEDFGIRLENDFLVKKDGAEDLFEQLMPLDIEMYILK